MRQVPVASLAAHLLKLRAAGYMLVGLEQTADSTPLPDYRWGRNITTGPTEHT